MTDAHVTDEAGFEACVRIRTQVFVEEQDVPMDRELDGRDDEADHFLLRDDGEGVACARLREYEDGVGKVERVAVLADRRGEGWGAAVMDAVETFARDAGYDELVLDAQTQVVEFYDALGYEVTSDEEFMDAGIPHLRMRKPL